jgi:glycosyltransferase involved in cell wall biosynthesis
MLRNLSILVPLFNEKDVILKTIDKLKHTKKSNNNISFEFIFIDDGSEDNTLNIILDRIKNDSDFKVISLSRNFGHQIALTAGIDFSNAEYISVLDADLQDPPEILIEMYKKAISGNFDVIYGRRIERLGETFFKKITAKLFYKFMAFLSDTNMPENVGDFRVMSKRVCDNIKEMRERHRYIRGLVPWLGFKYDFYDYVRQPRLLGKTKFSFGRMLNLSVDGILSFSTKPMKYAIRLGIFTILASFILGLYVIWLKLFTDRAIQGFTGITIGMILFSGIQITLMGLLGKYISMIFEEVKRRPLYIINRTYNL